MNIFQLKPNCLYQGFIRPYKDSNEGRLDYVLFLGTAPWPYEEQLIAHYAYKQTQNEIKWKSAEFFLSYVNNWEEI